MTVRLPTVGEGEEPPQFGSITRKLSASVRVLPVSAPPATFTRREIFLPPKPNGAARPIDRIPISLTINGERRDLSVAPWTVLLDLLREDLQLTGSKKGCDHGQCGACTILIDGQRINSCLVLAVMKDGASVTTIEGLGQPGSLHPMQEAFIEHDAFQCGYCTPGQICSAVGLVEEGRAQTPDEIRELMSGNVCRCGAYVNIVAAVEQVVASGLGGVPR